MCGERGGHAWQEGWNAVRIILECILVLFKIMSLSTTTTTLSFLIAENEGEQYSALPNDIGYIGR